MGDARVIPLRGVGPADPGGEADPGAAASTVAGPAARAAGRTRSARSAGARRSVESADGIGPAGSAEATRSADSAGGTRSAGSAGGKRSADWAGGTRSAGSAGATRAAGAAGDGRPAGSAGSSRFDGPGGDAANGATRSARPADRTPLRGYRSERDAEPDPRPDWERAVVNGLAFLRRRLTGDYEVDEFGYDRDLTEHLYTPLFRLMYSRWFRVEVSRIENVPDAGAALVVANHSGTLPIDSVMTQLALFDHHPARRQLRMLGADLVFRLPFVGEVARKAGHTLACNADAERLLGNGELVGVWPEGFKGTGKPFSERYKLQRFGRGGFVGAALRTGVPIIPCSIVGAEEIYPMIANAAPLARLLNLPYFPITPTFPWFGPLGMVPLPPKWLIEFGEPIETASIGPAAADDPMVVFNLTDQVRETIQQTLYRLLRQRGSVFS